MDEERDEFLPTRQSLLTRLKDWDDQEAWREFFETYWKLIYGVALKAGLTPPEAEDIVQETIIAVARKMPRFHYDPALGSFKTWLLLNIRSRIVDYLRKQGADKRRVVALPDTGTGTNALERIADPAFDRLGAAWDDEWEQRLFEAALERVKSRVSAKQFLIFDLYAVKQTPLRKITRSLGVNAAQVYLAKHRVRRLVKEEVARLARGLGRA